MISDRIKLSIIVKVQAENVLQNTLESIFEANSDVSGQVEVIVLDAVCSEESEGELKEASKRYEQQHFQTKAVDGTLSEAVNMCAEEASGDYVAVTEAGTLYSGGSLAAVIGKANQDHPTMVSLRPLQIDTNGREKAYPICPLETGTYDVIETPENMQFQLKCCFIQKDIFEKIKLRSENGINDAHIFLVDLFLQYPSYDFIQEHTVTFFTGEENDSSTNLYQYQKEWYTETVAQVMTPYMRSVQNLPDAQKQFVSCCMIYLLYVKFHCNVDDRNKNVLDREALDEFVEACGQLLTYIDETIILQKVMIGKYNIPRSLKMLFVRMRVKALGADFEIIDDGKCFALPVYNLLEEEDDGELSEADRYCTIGKINSEAVLVQAINYRDSALETDAFITLSDFLAPEKIHVFVEVDEEQVEITPTQAYPLMKCFGVTYVRKFPFHVSIPLKKSQNKQKIVFYLMVNGKKKVLNIRFPKTASRLSGKMTQHGYWEYAPNRILYKYKSALYTLKQGALHHLVRELRLMREIWKKNADKKQARSILTLRMAYHLVRPFCRNKKIWITNDKIYKAGDNGEYMYHYIHDNIKDVKIYYIVGKDAPDYKRMKANHENILVHGSFKCRLVSLLAETMLATHATILSYCGIDKEQQPYLKDLFHAEVICIQHGLTIQKIAQFQGRLFDNTNFYCCASKYEVENIMKPIYDYNEKDVALVGMARYDGLKNNDKKQILITPTWRKDVVNSGIAFIKKTHNNHFKETEYYRIYNGLINDQELIQCAKECGYAIIYLLHPAMSSQSVDYERNDYVQIVEATGDMSYEKILTESSLMVTDYSGVQFDFAYMRKPVLYYHPDSLPPHYEEGGLIYDTMGFGPICKNHRQIVDALCKAMRRNCENEELYIQRANDFFAFDDFNNCKRIYEASENYMKTVRANR